MKNVFLLVMFIFLATSITSCVDNDDNLENYLQVDEKATSKEDSVNSNSGSNEDLDNGED